MLARRQVPVHGPGQTVTVSSLWLLTPCASSPWSTEGAQQGEGLISTFLLLWLVSNKYTSVYVPLARTMWPILEAKEQLGTVTPAATSASSDNFMLWEEVYEFSCPVSHPVARYNLFAFFFPKEIFLPISKGDNPVSHPVSTCSVKSRPQYCLWAVFRKLWPNRQVLCASLTPAKMWNRCTITATQTPVRKELNNGRQTASALHGT